MCCEVGLEYKELVDRKTILLIPQLIYTKGIKLKSFLSLSLSVLTVLTVLSLLTKLHVAYVVIYGINQI